MESDEASVQYSRWSEENMNMPVPESQSRLTGLYHTLCTGRLGIVTKVAASLTMLAVIYIAGYITGYYVHMWMRTLILKELQKMAFEA